MHQPGPLPRPAGWSRRDLLRALAAAGTVGSAGSVTGCGLRVQPLAGDPPPPPLEPDADELARRRAAARAAELQASATAAAGARPEAAGLLTAVAAAHAEQLVALGEPSGAAQDAPSSPPPDPAADPAAGAVPVDGLAAAQAAAAEEALADLAGGTGVTGGMARLLGSIAAGDRAAAARVAAALGQDAPAGTGYATGSGGVAAGPTATASAAGSSAPGDEGPAEAEPGPDEQRALAATLAGAEAAVYAYGALTVHLAGAARRRGLDCLADHRAAADALEQRITDAGGTAPAEEPGYVLPSPVQDDAAALDLALGVEQRAAASAADLVAAAAPQGRSLGARLLTGAAARADAWRAERGDATVVALPGLGDRLGG